MTSFGTYVADATHWYGKVGRDGDSYSAAIPLLRVLDALAAQRLSDPEFTFYTGDETERFDSRADVIAAAVVAFQRLAQVGDRLRLGRDLGLVRQDLAVKS